MGDIPVEIALSIRAQHAEGPLGDAATARLWRVNIIGVIFRCRPGVTGPPSPRYASGLTLDDADGGSDPARA